MAHPLGRSIALAVLMLASMPRVGIASGTPHPSERWSWLAADGGTYWYVPQAGLPAYRWHTSNPADASQVSDQTVWHIERFENGYVFGPVVAQLDDESPQCQYLIGSITPEGQVYLTFNATGGSGSPALTTGIGTIIEDPAGPVFQMQMATGSDKLQVTHWARMTQCRAGEACWTDLPGLDGTSVPEFLGNCGTD